MTMYSKVLEPDTLIHSRPGCFLPPANEVWGKVIFSGTPPPGPGTPPPGAEHAGRYGQRAGGMHPTGMQSC